ncbi:MAG: tetratricopeptide repeat protein [Cyanobacteriota bacterium]|nr:tetratricopeptide repeat protein [Cyanobacteriota bacterium]
MKKTTVKTHLELAKIYSNRQEWEEAIECYENAIKQKPDDWEIYSDRGNALTNLQHWQEAVKAYKKAIQFNPKSAELYSSLAETFAKLEKWDEAIACWQKCLEINPNAVSVYSKLGDMFVKKVASDRSELINIYQDKIEENPDSVDIYYAALEIEPDNPRLYAGLANVLTNQGDFDTAIAAYKKALEFQPNSVKNVLELDKVLQKRDNTFQTNSKETSRIDSSKQQLTVLNKINLESFLSTGAIIEFPKGENPEVSIILILHNRAEYTLACLESILKSNFVSLEVVIIDNNSTDETGQLLERIKGVKIVKNVENLHYLVGTHQGVEVAKGDFLLFLNNDTQILGESINAAIATIKSDPDIGAVGGKMIYPDGSLQEAGSIIWQDGSCHCYGRGDVANASEYMFRREVDYCCGAFLLTPRELFLEMGGFDIDYKPAYYEETDYCVRLHKLGKKVIYEPNVNVLHYEFASSSRENGLKLMEKNRQIFIEKHQDWLKFQYQPNIKNILLARRARGKAERVLFICQEISDVSEDSKMRSSMKKLDEMGCSVTIYPLTKIEAVKWTEIYSFFPRDMEAMVDGNLSKLEGFLRERKGYYDIVYVGQNKDADKVKEILFVENWLEGVKIIYEVERGY